MNNNLAIAQIMLDGLIATVETKSEIPVQLSELKTLKILLSGSPMPTKTVVGDSVQPALRAATMGLFPTMETLQSVVDLATSQLPVTNANQIVSLLMIYHNTLLQILEQETNFVPRKEI